MGQRRRANPDRDDSQWTDHEHQATGHGTCMNYRDHDARLCCDRGGAHGSGRAHCGRVGMFGEHGNPKQFRDQQRRGIICR